MKLCNKCGEAFEYPTGIKKYGSHYLCNECVRTETHCDGCSKRRYKKLKTVEGLLCAECVHEREYQQGRYSWICNGCGLVHFKLPAAPKDILAWGLSQNVHWCNECLPKHSVYETPLKTGNCSLCGDGCIVTEIDGVEVFVCETCKQERINITLCKHCKKTAVCEGNNHSYGDGHVCYDCYNNHYTMCQGCRETVLLTDAHKVAGTRRLFVDTGYVCSACIKNYNTCPRCGKKDILRRVEGFSKKLCKACIGNARKCGYCKKYSLEYVNTPYGGACASCRHEKGWGVQRKYNYRPAQFNFLGNAQVYFGIENEIGLCTDFDKQLYLNHIASTFHPNHVYTQHDGTIDFGTEVVFHPMTLKRASKFPFEKLFVEQVRPSTTCGMHIHINKSAFNKFHLYKFMRFISQNQQFVEFIAGRKQRTVRDAEYYRVGWCFTDSELLLEKAKGKMVVDPHKYTDINTKHPDTVELRIFKGADSADEMRKNIEFTHCLWAFSNKSSHKNLTFENFLEYLRGHVSMYPNLFAFVRQPYNL